MQSSKCSQTAMGIGLERSSGTKFDKMRIAKPISRAQLMNFQTGSKKSGV